MDIHHYIHYKDEHTKVLLEKIFETVINNNHKLKNIMTKQEYADAMNAANAVLQKAFEEVVAAIQNLDNTSPEMDAALVKFQNAAKAFDELNPDAPAPPPVEG